MNIELEIAAPYTGSRGDVSGSSAADLVGVDEEIELCGPQGRYLVLEYSATSVHFDIDLVTPDALVPTTTDAEIRRWWQSAFDTRVAEFLKS